MIPKEKNSINSIWSVKDDQFSNFVLVFWDRILYTSTWSWLHYGVEVVLKPMHLLPQFPWIPGVIHHVRLRWLRLKSHAGSIKRGKAGATDWGQGVRDFQNRKLCALLENADWLLDCWEGRTCLRRVGGCSVCSLPWQWVDSPLPTLGVWLLGPDQLFTSASPLPSCSRVEVRDNNLPLWTCAVSVSGILIASASGDDAPENARDKCAGGCW